MSQAIHHSSIIDAKRREELLVNALYVAFRIAGIKPNSVVRDEVDAMVSRIGSYLQDGEVRLLTAEEKAEIERHAGLDKATLSCMATEVPK